MKTYKCITLHQPWASWIAWGLKTIETRTHDRFAGLVGQRIAIHAGRAFDEDSFEQAGYAQVLSGDTDGCDADRDAAFEKLVNFNEKPAEKWQDVFPSGAVVCLATVTETRILTQADERAALCECKGLHGLFLSDVQVLAEPVPAKGKQGIWSIDL